MPQSTQRSRFLIAAGMACALLLLVLLDGWLQPTVGGPALAQTRSTPTFTPVGAPTATPTALPGQPYAHIELASQSFDAPLLVRAHAFAAEPHTLVLATFRLEDGRASQVYGQNFPRPAGLTDQTFALEPEQSWFPTTGTYLVQVVLYPASGPALDWENSQSFSRPISAPAWARLTGESRLGSSTSLTRHRDVDLSWQAVSGAAGYALRLTNAQGALLGTTTVDGATFALSNWARLTEDGLHTLTVQALAPAGGLSAPVSASILLDSTPPPAPASVTVSPSLANRGTNIAVSWAAVVGAEVYRIDVTRPDGSSYRATAAAGGADLACCATSINLSSGDGLYQLRVSAIDAAGNTGAARAAPFTLDTLPPPAPSSISAASAVSTSLVYAAWPPVPEAEAYVLVRRDPNGTLTSPLTQTVTSLDWPLGANDGLYELRVFSVDAAGNRSTSYRATSVQRDRVAPPSPGLPSVPALTNQTAVTLAWEGTPDTAVYEIELLRPDGSSTRASVAAPATVFSQLALDGHDGVYSVRLFAIDAAGNRSAASPAALIERDTTPVPALGEAPAGPTLTRLRRVVVSWPPISATASTAISLTAPSGLSQRTLLASPGVTLTLDLQEGDGVYGVAVAGVDPAGNQAEFSPPLIITLDTTPPPAPAAPPLLPERSAALSTTFHWPAVADAASYEVWVNGSLYLTTSEPAGALGGEDGDLLVVSVRALDAAGNAGAFTTPASLRIDRSAPELESSLDPLTDGSGAELRWVTESDTRAELWRLGPDGQELSLGAVSSPLFLPVPYGEELRGRLVVSDTVGNSLALPFGPLLVSRLDIAGVLVDRNGGALAPGDALSLTLVVANTGAAPQPATLVELPLPAGLTVEGGASISSLAPPQRWSLGLLPAGASRTISLALRVQPDGAGKNITLRPAVFSQIAPVQRATLRPAGSDGTVTAAAGQPFPTLTLADLDGGALLVGDTVSITLRVEARGGALSGLSTRFSLPSWLTLISSGAARQGWGELIWPIGELAAGQSASTELVGQIDAAGLDQTLTLAPLVRAHQSVEFRMDARRLGPVVSSAEPATKRSEVRVPLLVRQ
jgi:hypothetical protein